MGAVAEGKDFVEIEAADALKEEEVLGNGCLVGKGVGGGGELGGKVAGEGYEILEGLLAIWFVS